jgi:hypothetical protein
VGAAWLQLGGEGGSRGGGSAEGRRCSTMCSGFAVFRCCSWEARCYVCFAWGRKG